MEKRRLKFVIPSMVIVAIGAIFMLKNNFEEVSMSDSVILVIFATLFSGFVAYILFPHDDGKKPDPKPANQKNSKKKISK